MSKFVINMEYSTNYPLSDIDKRRMIRYRLGTQEYRIYDSLKTINEDVLKWQLCRLEDTD